MRRFLPFFFAIPVFLITAQSTASSLLDFDQGVDVRPVIRQAGEIAVPGGDAVSPETIPANADDTVWISISRNDAGALGDELLKRALVGQNDSISIYELKVSGLDPLAAAMQRRFHMSPGFFTHDSLASALEDLSQPPPAAARAFSIDQGEKVAAMLKLVNEDAVTAIISRLSEYKNRYYRSVTGVASSKWIYDHWKELSAGRSDITVTAFPHSAYPQESVILTVRGTIEPDKVVVVGAHQDSTAGGSDKPAPGADDNASGIAVVNEVIRVVAASGYKPAQTLKFMAFAAEEVGLRGSQEIAAGFKKEGVAVQGMLNLDMTNYKGSAEDIFFISDNTNAPQNAFLGKLVSTYTGYNWAATRCGYGCSDHASWTKNGFAASFPFEAKMGEDNPNIHTAKDTLAQMGGRATHSFKFAKLAVAYIVEMAK
ncbi:MAG: M20/M25/M40 family metallo-hydrolase [Elusimicrobia bacterium]|nr:M20/M25/M40 family metallo-hydrolase [Elusimicrobiota bacterium]